MVAAAVIGAVSLIVPPGIIDLTSLTRVASLDLGAQAGGIDFWKSEAPK